MTMPRPSDGGATVCAARKARYGGESDTDPRLVEYIQALKAYDVKRLIELRLEYVDDSGLQMRFDTVQTVFAGLLSLYEREIQILRLEVEGWKSIDEGKEWLEEEGLNKKDRAAARQCVYRGLVRLEKALEYRNTQREIELPNTFI